MEVYNGWHADNQEDLDHKQGQEFATEQVNSMFETQNQFFLNENELVNLNTGDTD